MSASKFIIGRCKAIGYALKGAVILIKTEASIQVQAAIAIIMTIAGFYFNITATQWIAQTLCIGLIMGLEGMNTTAEAIADFIHPDFHEKIGHIKDIAAGAVVITAIASTIVGGIIYIPYLVALFN
ncbi:diacylglycerol kinase family protein [uncultured Nonlabens sp.]|uniref:diacylglycerol kinase n=1 Tax=uncultured Nonlabens sp. TaxID=859306 RepID=UPI00262E3289|nr:diacylglycerol kinase family protein [uncultured Nonlabens sp.]